jgi:hypothetical protein
MHYCESPITAHELDECYTNKLTGEFSVVIRMPIEDVMSTAGDDDDLRDTLASYFEGIEINSLSFHFMGFVSQMPQDDSIYGYLFVHVKGFATLVEE